MITSVVAGEGAFGNTLAAVFSGATVKTADGSVHHNGLPYRILASRRELMDGLPLGSRIYCASFQCDV